jgi:hypothetical protein
MSITFFLLIAASKITVLFNARPLGQAPSRDDLIVLCFDDPAQAEQVATRLAALGHPRVEAENLCWTANDAITVEDPDRWQITGRPLHGQGDGEPLP